MTFQNQKIRYSITILSKIFRLSFPIALSLLVQAFYNIVDSFYISRFSSSGLTALSLAFPIQLFIIALGTGNSTGCGILVSYCLGEKNFSAASNSAIHGFLLSVIHWVLFAVFSFPFLIFYFHFYPSNTLIQNMGLTYTSYVCIFSVFQFIENTSSRILYSLENSIAPMTAQICGAVINIILDPLLIFGLGPLPSLGVSGAAFATITGQFFSMILSLFFLKREKLKLYKKYFKFSIPVLKTIYKAGFPTFFMQSLVAFYVSGLNFVLKPFGEYAITSLGIYYKLQTFLLMPTNSISLAITPLMSYYHGGKVYKKVWSIYRHSLFLSFFTMLLGTLIFQLFPSQLVSLFSPDRELLTTAVTALKIISLSFPFFSFTIIIPVLLQVTGYTKENLMITFTRQILFLVPLGWLLSFFGLNAVWFTFPISEILASVISWFYRCKIQRQFAKIHEL